VNRPLPGPARDVALLLARLLLGTIMFAHGYQKLMIDGIGRTTDGFESMSIPVAIFSAAFVTVVEVVGGVLMVVGALVPVVAACYLVVMVGAAVFVHIPNGVFVASGGWELVGAIAAVLLALAAAGSGRYGLDHLVRSRQERAAADDASSSVTVTFRPPAKHATRQDHSARATSFVEPAFVESSDDPLPVRRPSVEPPASPS
jgi:putative oxidoreductase